MVDDNDNDASNAIAVDIQQDAARLDRDAESSSSNAGATALLTLLVITLSMLIAALLLVVYSQRRRLMNVLSENRFVSRYRGGHTWSRTGGVSHSLASGKGGQLRTATTAQLTLQFTDCSGHQSLAR